MPRRLTPKDEQTLLMMRESVMDMRPHARRIPVWAMPVALVLAAAALLLLALGCGGGDTATTPPTAGGENPSAAPATSIELRYMRWGLPEEIESERELLHVFEQQHPGITVKLEYAAWDQYWTKLQAQFAAKQAPDVMLMGGEYLLDFMQRKLLADLQPRLTSDTQIKLADYYDAPVNLFSREGGVYGLPRDCNTIGIYYNRSLFEKAGAPLPTADWTWDTFLAAAQQLTRDENADGRMEHWGYLASYQSIEENWGGWVWQYGGQILTPDSRTCLLDQPAAIGGLQYLADLTLKHKVSPSTEEMASFAHGMNMFIAGRVAMVSSGSWGIKAYRAIEDFKWDVAPLPAGPGGAAAPINGLGYSINAASKQTDAAWLLAKFLVSPPAQEILARSGTSIPALRSVAKSPVYLDGIPDGKRHFLTQLATGRTLPFTPGFAKWEAAVRQELELAWLGQQTVEQAAQKATLAVNAILAEQH